MWYRITPALPYHADSDYQDSLVHQIKQRLGDVPVDVTFFSYGFAEVYTEDPATLSRVPLIQKVRSSVDREMTLGPRTIL